MFDEQKYGVFDEFRSVDDLRRHMIDYGHLFFYINGRYYLLYGTHHINERGEWLPWWNISNGDVMNERYATELCRETYWSTYDFDEIWRIPLFYGKSFENNFSEFIFFSE